MNWNPQPFDCFLDIENASGSAMTKTDSFCHASHGFTSECVGDTSIQFCSRCAQPKLVLTGSPMLRFNLKDKLPLLTTSMCIYQFTCSCEVRYIGCTTRQLHKRIKEHHPVRLTRGTISTIRSSILKHLVDSNHRIDIERAFHILYTTPVS